MSAKTLAILHGIQSTLIVAGCIVLWQLKRIPLDTAAAILGTIGGSWSGVAVALKSSSSNAAAAGPDTTTSVVGAAAAPIPSTHVAPVSVGGPATPAP